MSKEAAAPEKPAEGEAAPAKAPNPLIPVIAVVVLMPAITFAMINFLLLPKIRGIVLEQKATEHAEGGEKADAHGAKPAAGHGAKPASAHGAKEEKKEAKGGHGKEAKGGGGGGGAGGAFSYDFENVVVNLAGTMGTRYLKTTFTVLSDNPEIKTIIDENKKQLLDVASGVLSTRTLADLEQPGAKNVVRNDLVANLNQALKSDAITQIYFSDFVVQ